MLHLITGLPGNGKTLLATAKVPELFGDRDVYVHGIPDLKLPWFNLDNPERWYELPDGAVVVIDEAQKIFPVRPSTQPVPTKCSQFETHRHKGFDIVLITQDAKLLDVHVRRLVGVHWHVERKFGVEAARLLQFEGCADPGDYHERQKAVGSVFKFPKKNFGLYRSTTLNTHKSYLPKKLLLVPLFIGLLAICAWFGVRALSNIAGVDKPAEPSPVSSTMQKVKAIESKPAAAGGDKKPLTLSEFTQRFYPRLPDLPWSAPIFDSMAVPAVMPVVAGCVESREAGCRCYSQQGTLLPTVSQAFCRDYIERGGFQMFSDKAINGEGREVAVAKSERSEVPSDQVAIRARGHSLERPVVPAAIQPGAVAPAGDDGGIRGRYLLQPSAALPVLTPQTSTVSSVPSSGVSERRR